MVSLLIRELEWSWKIKLWTWLNVVSLYFCSFERKKRLLSDITNENGARYSRGCLKNGGYCSNCVMFLFFIPVKLCASIFHEFPSSCLCHKVKWPERGGKCHRITARKRGKNTREELASGIRKRLLTPLRTEVKLRIQLFSIYLEREVADEKCFRGRQTFFGWANTDSHIYSRNKTQTDFYPLPPSRVTHLVIYIFLVVFFFIILSMFQDS